MEGGNHEWRDKETSVSRVTKMDDSSTCVTPHFYVHTLNTALPQKMASITVRRFVVFCRSGVRLCSAKFTTERGLSLHKRDLQAPCKHPCVSCQGGNRREFNLRRKKISDAGSQYL